MRIVVNDIAASEGGALSVLQDFYNEILKSSDSDNIEWFFLLADKSFLQETNNIKIFEYPNIKKSWIKRIMFDFFYGRKIINSFKPDLYVSLQNTATLGIKAKQVVYLHQPLPYQDEKRFSIFKNGEKKLAIYQTVIGFIFNTLFRITKSDIVVQTNWMRDSLNKKIKNKVFVIPPDVALDTREEDWCCTEPIFFYPSSELLYKNHNILYDAVDLIVDQGYFNFKVVLTIKNREINNATKYEFIDKISRSEVFRRYQKSILIFPSYIETYGLPLKEAQLFRAPIIASDTLFSREILEKYPRSAFFDKFDSQQLAKIMIDHICNIEKLNNEVNKFEFDKNEVTVSFLHYLINQVKGL